MLGPELEAELSELDNVLIVRVNPLFIKNLEVVEKALDDCFPDKQVILLDSSIDLLRIDPVFQEEEDVNLKDE